MLLNGVDHCLSESSPQQVRAYELQAYELMEWPSLDTFKQIVAVSADKELGKRIKMFLLFSPDDFVENIDCFPNFLIPRSIDLNRSQ